MRFYLDFKSPDAYLAMKPTLELVLRHDLEISWLPFRSVEQIVPDEKPHETKGETHRRVRAVARRRTHLMYADIQGIPMTFPEHPTSTDLALSALLTTGDSSVDFIRAGFQAYWVEQQDLNDPAVVKALLEDAGRDPSEWLGLDHKALLTENQRAAGELGVVDVPAYLIDDQVFIGRAHLPWIESLILKQA